MGLLLHQRGRVVLHASAVSIGDNAAIFLGPSGAGKSTMAATIHEEGYPILEDDVVSIRFENGNPIVDPGIPDLRLSTDIIDGLGYDEQNLTPDHLIGEKKYKSVDSSDTPSPLKCCYILQPSDQTSLESCTDMNTVVYLISNSYAQKYISDMGLEAHNFEQCSNVAHNTNFQILNRTSDIDELRSPARLVISDMLDN
jgi:hypothetical protein